MDRMEDRMEVEERGKWETSAPSILMGYRVWRKKNGTSPHTHHQPKTSYQTRFSKLLSNLPLCRQSPFKWLAVFSWKTTDRRRCAPRWPSRVTAAKPVITCRDKKELTSLLLTRKQEKINENKLLKFIPYRNVVHTIACYNVTLDHVIGI